MMPEYQPQPTPARAKWLSFGEMMRNLVAAIILSGVVYMIAGQSFLFFGLDIGTYYFGTRTAATITTTNVSGFFGVPGDDAQDQIGATGTFTDSHGQMYTLFIQDANTLHQQVAISYLPMWPEVAVERADYEQRAGFYIAIFSFSALILFAYWHYILRPLLTWRVKLDWKIKTIRKKTKGVMPRRSTYTI